MGCSRDFCRILSYARRADRCSLKSLKANILSAEAKVIAALIDKDECIIKDIPSITGLSDRHCYNVINKLAETGILLNTKSVKDKRTKIVKLVHDKMCEIVCQKLHELDQFN